MTTVLNLATGERQLYECNSRAAVIAAFAQSQRDWNTWDYPLRYAGLVETGDHVVTCGDFSAFFCECHKHEF